MDHAFYLKEFQQAAASLNQQLLAKKALEVEVGVWLDSVVFRLLKKSWANQPFKKPQSDSSIFFSIWLNNDAEKQSKLLYNIHALKLRKLHGYSLTSRDFASDFRDRFEDFAHHWPNVSTSFGPLTLMQGWKQVELTSFSADILELANQFMEIDFIIDDLLSVNLKKR